MPKPHLLKRLGIVRSTARRTRLLAALIGAALVAMTGYGALFRAGEPLVTLSYDLPFIVHRAGPTEEICIVYLDKLDGDAVDRSTQAKLLDELGKAGASAVVYDLIFDVPSADPAVDIEFAAAIRRFRGVGADGQPLPGATPRRVLLACGRENFNMTGISGERLLPPIDPLLDAADDFGLVVWDDDILTIRELATGTRDEPSLIWKAAVLLGSDLPEDRRLDRRWVNFAGPPARPGDRYSVSSFQSCSADSVLLGGVSPLFFRNKIVVVGGKPGIVGTELGQDMFATPFHRFRVGGKLPLMSGVEIQANGLANLIRQNWLTRTTPDFECAFLLIAGLLIGGTLAFLRPVPAILTALGLTGLAATAGVMSVHFGEIWFPWTVVAFAQVPAALVWGIAAHSYIERFFRLKLTAEQAAIRTAFAKYLSPQMLDRLTAQGFDMNLGGEKIEAAMMFTDLEGFTDMCERIRDPQRIVATLNNYFGRTTDSIFENDGGIIKFIGDAIFAAWGSPLPDPEAPQKAVRAAWRLFESDKLVVEGEELKTRIGLHFGEVVAGNVGSERRVDFTLIGDAVNLAARLEGLNKLLGTHILMSDAIRAKVGGEYRTRRVGTFRVKGRREEVTVHELLGPVVESHEPPWISDFHHALDALAANRPAEALEFFQSCQAKRGPHGDGPSRFFIHLIESGQSAPDGIVEMKEK